MKRNIVVFIIMVIVVGGCYYDKEELLYPGTVDCSTVNARFVDVLPVITLRCATTGCHNSTAAAGGVVLENYFQISSKKDRILQRAVIEKSMPAGTPLSVTETALLKCWISSGALNN